MVCCPFAVHLVPQLLIILFLMLTKLFIFSALVWTPVLAVALVALLFWDFTALFENDFS